MIRPTADRAGCARATPPERPAFLDERCMLDAFWMTDGPDSAEPMAVGTFDAPLPEAPDEGLAGCLMVRDVDPHVCDVSWSTRPDGRVVDYHVYHAHVEAADVATFTRWLADPANYRKFAARFGPLVVRVGADIEERPVEMDVIDIWWDGGFAYAFIRQRMPADLTMARAADHWRWLDAAFAAQVLDSTGAEARAAELARTEARRRETGSAAAVALATAVLRDPEEARRWVMAPHPLLAERTPYEAAARGDTDALMQAVYVLADAQRGQASR